MWKDLRSHLERWGILEPAYDRLTLSGQVCSPELEPVNADEFRSVLLSVGSGEGRGQMRRLGPDGRFVLDLPMDRTVRITIVLQGHLPRIVEIRPLRSSLRMARVRVHARCGIEITLTPRRTSDGIPIRPLMERIIMPRPPQPLIVEWDHVMRTEQREQFVPLFLRATDGGW